MMTKNQKCVFVNCLRTLNKGMLQSELLCLLCYISYKPCQNFIIQSNFGMMEASKNNSMLQHQTFTSTLLKLLQRLHQVQVSSTLVMSLLKNYLGTVPAEMSLSSQIQRSMLAFQTQVNQNFCKTIRLNLPIRRLFHAMSPTWMKLLVNIKMRLRSSAGNTETYRKTQSTINSKRTGKSKNPDK